MTTLADDLEAFGLTPNETKIYLALLKLGPTTSGKIIKETKIRVSAVYYALNNLQEKGLVTHVIKANRKQFQAAEPGQLLAFAEEKRRLAEDLIPRLEPLVKSAKEPVSAVVHEGYKGYKGVYDRLFRTLKKGDEYFVFGARQIGDPVNEELNIMLTSFHRLREKRGIKAKIIFNEDVRKNVLEKTPEFKLMETRFMATPTNSYVLTYADRVITFLFTERLLAVEIVSKEVADSYREFFKLMWKSAER
ncbi:HTH-type sugar sensing transcriptional regulator TrmBL1 [uncultured archaeon]|nr:HTH-type sugar sensing transcriptional regulator TrmBL1 [uncultured archaeon]